MERDIRADRTFTSMADKLYFLCEISWEMLSTNRMSLNYRQFPDRIRRLFGPIVQEQKDMDHWHYDMMGQTILVRNSDGDYAPAHRSLIEFFAAYKFAAEMGALAPDFTELAQMQADLDSSVEPIDCAWSAYFQRRVNEVGEPEPSPRLRSFAHEAFDKLAVTVGKEPFSPAILSLMEGMVLQERLLFLIAATRGEEAWRILHAGGNAATIYARSGGSFRTLNLRNTNLAGADLYRCDLTDADCQSAILHGANLYEANLGGANLSDADLTGATMYHCWARQAQFDHLVIDADRILVFLGQWAELMRKGSTLLDAAFQIHSEIGFRCAGGSVNNEPADIDTILPDGARVWISKNEQRYTATTDWLSFAVSQKATGLIARHFRRIEATAKEILLRELKQIYDTEPPAYEHQKRQFDNLLQQHAGVVFDLLLKVVIPDLDGEYSQYGEIVAGGAFRQDTARKMYFALRRYDLLLYELTKAGITPNKPRTYPRLMNLLRSLPIDREFGVASSDQFLLAVLSGEISLSGVSQNLANLGRREVAEYT